MKLTTILFMAAILQVSASTKAQTVTLSEKSAPLKEVFNKISDQTGFDFVVSTSVLKLAAPVTISVKDKTLKTVLDEIFTNQPLQYQLQEKAVIVTRKEPVSKPDQKTAIPPLTINGRVQDSLSKPLPGATLKNLATGISATTDVQGQFSLQGNEGDKVQVSFVGFTPYTFQIHQQQADLVITLNPLVSKLSEVAIVSTGYQTIPKERAAGSFSQPIKTEFDARVAPDVLSKLNGITSGLLFNANTLNTQGGKLDLNIRSRSTIFANDQPLIVVDNFPYNGDINNINPNDVQSITVLKDAAAASIWGVRAGNGVIVITTKTGRNRQPLTVNFNASVTQFDKPNLNYNPNQLDATSYINLEKFLFGKGFYDSNLNNTSTYPVISPVVELLAANRAGTLSPADLNAQLTALSAINVNNQLQNYFYQKAVDQQYSASFSGGTDKTNYYFSTGYDDDLASTKKNGNNRLTLNAQNVYQIAKDLELTAGLNVVQTQTQYDNTIGQVRGHIFPYSQIADSNGNPLPISYNFRQSFVQNAPSLGLLDWSFVPLNELGATENTSKTMDLRLATGIKYLLGNGLTAEIKYQYENTNFRNRDFQSQQTYYTRNYINQFSIVSNGKVTGYNVPLGGILNLANSNSASNNLRTQISYDKSWNDNRFSALAGYEFSQVNAESNQSILYGYDDDLATFSNINPTTNFNTFPTGSSAIGSGLGINSTLVRVRSSFANFAYAYKDKYTLTSSARIDGTNYFGVATNQKSVPLWSVGGKWDIDKEAFYKIDWLPVLKLRATYGYNGNLIQSITGVTTFQYYSNAAYTNLNYAQISNLGNPDLRWEKTAIANFGVDFGTKNNTINGALEYYIKKETDLLGFKNFPENTGITKLEGNFSAMTGHGIDLTINTINLKGSFKWSSSFLFSHATDRVTHYDINPFGAQLTGAGTGIPNVGKPVFGVYGFKWGGLDPATGNPIGFLNGVSSQNYASIITNTPVDQLVYVGPARPVYFGGLNNHFFYKNFSLDIQISYKLGYYFTAPALSYSSITSSGAFLKVNRQFDERWVNPGDEKRTNVPSMVYPFSAARDQFYQYSTVNIEKGDHVRLQDVTFSYDFNSQNSKAIPFNNLRLFFYANNIGIIWKANHKGLDPDAIPSPGDNATMPVPRSFAIGIKGSF